MADSIMQAYHVEHPAPHGAAVGKGVLFAGLLAAPVAWSLQLLIDYGFASQSCFPRSQPLAAPSMGAGALWTLLLVINVAALVVALIGTFVSYRSWSRTREEVSGHHDHLLEAGEGRTRFLAVWGIWAGVWFAIAIVFNTIGVFGVPVCGL